MGTVYWRAFLAQLTQAGIAFDQFLSTLVGLLSLACAAIVRRQRPPATHMADETISAMLYRKHRDGKPWGLLLMKPVDLVFSLWQRDEAGNVVHDHCHQAFLKEHSRKNLPAEYEEAAQ